MQHDPDDPPPAETWTDHYWWFANRFAESGMKCARMFGLI